MKRIPLSRIARAGFVKAASPLAIACAPSKVDIGVQSAQNSLYSVSEAKFWA